MDLRKLYRCGVVAVKHCNLNCTACNHLSPMFKAEILEVDSFRKSLEFLAPHLHFGAIVLQGGEPLLHPKIDELLAVARLSGIADRVTVLTNGTLLHRMSDAFWGLVDQVELSAYPGVDRPALDAAKTAKVKVTQQDTFTEAFSTIRNEDEDLVWKIKDRCRLYNRCFSISGAYFYKCIISAFIPSQIRHPALAPATVDGLKIYGGESFRAHLEAFIASEVPLRSCEFCCGVIGKRFPQTQVERGSFLDRHHRPVAEMLEPSLLERNINQEMRRRENA